MPNYPEKTCSIDRLVRNAKLVSAALEGRKTQQRRDGVYGYPGETFELGDQTFLLTTLTRQGLGEMTNTDAKAEGYADLAAYKDLIIRMHPGMKWNEDHLVWVHSFEMQT